MLTLVLVLSLAGEACGGPVERGTPTWFTASSAVDLTHTLDEKSPVWPSATRFQRSLLVDYDQGYRKFEFRLDEGIGTHLDTPAHFVKGGRSIDDLELTELIAPAIVVGVTDKVQDNPDYQLTVADLKAWEADHGTIPQGSIVLMHSGWDARWPDEARYRNTDARGIMHFPGFAPETAKFLIEKRDIAGIGIDTLSLDYGPSTDFAVHQMMLEHDRFQIENLTRLGKLPPQGGVLVALPVKFQEAPEAPARVIALVPK